MFDALVIKGANINIRIYRVKNSPIAARTFTALPVPSRPRTLMVSKAMSRAGLDCLFALIIIIKLKYIHWHALRCWDSLWGCGGRLHNPNMSLALHHITDNAVHWCSSVPPASTPVCMAVQERGSFHQVSADVMVAGSFDIGNDA